MESSIKRLGATCATTFHFGRHTRAAREHWKSKLMANMAREPARRRCGGSFGLSMRDEKAPVPAPVQGRRRS